MAYVRTRDMRRCRCACMLNVLHGYVCLPIMLYIYAQIMCVYLVGFVSKRQISCLRLPLTDNKAWFDLINILFPFKFTQFTFGMWNGSDLSVCCWWFPPDQQLKLYHNERNISSNPRQIRLSGDEISQPWILSICQPVDRRNSPTLPARSKTQRFLTIGVKFKLKGNLITLDLRVTTWKKLLFISRLPLWTYDPAPVWRQHSSSYTGAKVQGFR